METSLVLTCHPWTLTDVVRGVGARLRRIGDTELAFHFRLDADLRRVRVPQPSVTRIVYDLWQHTCFEAFVALDGSAAYHEYNFAPSTEWGAFAFERYREGAPVEDEALAPRITARVTGDVLELDALLALDHLSPAHTLAPLRVALSAVIEDTDGALSYWSLHHPPGQPDFHHADAFAARLPALEEDGG